MYLPYASLHHTLLDSCMHLMMQNYLWQMVHTRSVEESVRDNPESSTRRGQAPRGHAPGGNAPPPPPPHLPISLEQLLATQNELML
jgi:hypothetical protein